MEILIFGLCCIAFGYILGFQQATENHIKNLNKMWENIDDKVEEFLDSEINPKS